MNYLTTHLQEAIELNKERAPLYSKLTNGESDRISKSLLQSERLSLPSSYAMDKAAAYFQKRGVPVFVHEFISMDETPPFKEKFDDSNGITNECPGFSVDLVKNDLLSALKIDDYKAVSGLTKSILDDLNETPKHLCMIRHLIESIHRGANLLPIHLEKIKEKSLLFSPQKICHYTLWAQVVGLKPSLTIDRWAHPIQREGIPIIYQDVPHIPPMPENY